MIAASGGARGDEGEWWEALRKAATAAATEVEKLLAEAGAAVWTEGRPVGMMKDGQELKDDRSSLEVQMVVQLQATASETAATVVPMRDGDGDDSVVGGE